MAVTIWGNQQWQHLNPADNTFENVALPCSPNLMVDEATFRLSFDTHDVISPVMFISTLGVPFEIRSMGVLIYRFGDFQKDSFLGFPSHVVPLASSHGTLEFRLKITPYSKGICREIVIGERDSVYRKVVGDNILLVASSSFFVTISFAAIGLYFVLKRQPIFLYLFLFIFSATAWQFSNNSNPLKDLILSNPLIWGYIDIISLCIMPVAFLGLCIRLVGDRWYILRAAFVLHLLFLSVVIGGAIGGWNVAHAIKPFNVLLILSAVISFVYLMRQAFLLKKKFLFIGVATVILVVIHDILLWLNVLMWTNHLAPFGVLIFILFLGAESVNNGYRIARDAIDAQARMTAVREIMHNIAHDIRRPFSMAWQVLATAKQVGHLEKIDEAMRSVDGILNDIMDVDARIELHCEPVSLVNLFVDSIASIFPSFPEERIKLRWDLVQDCTLNVDKHKMLRVVENIIQNAVEATLGKEREIVFSFAFVPNKQRIVIGIKNSHSSVPHALREKIFQPYFSHGKERGKGIGLAICRRFVDAHGGTLKCISSEQGDGWTGFEILVSREIVAEGGALVSESLPSEWSEIEKYRDSKRQSAPVVSVESLRDELRLCFVKSSGVAEICIIDDEFVFAESAKVILEDSLLGRVSCSVMQVDDGIVERIGEGKFDGFIVDYDLGLKELDGIGLVEEIIKKFGHDAPIMMMTNRTIPSLAKEAEKLGIMLDAKPATEEKFLSFALEIFRLSKSLKPRVVVVDDESYVLDAWKSAMTDAVVTVFDNPYSFYDNIIDNPTELASTSCMILDYFFKGTDVEKENLVRAARRNGFMRPIILSSNRNYENDSVEEPDRFDAVVPKRASSFAELMKIQAVANAFQKYASMIKLS